MLMYVRSFVCLSGWYKELPIFILEHSGSVYGQSQVSLRPVLDLS